MLFLLHRPQFSHRRGNALLAGGQQGMIQSQIYYTRHPPISRALDLLSKASVAQATLHGEESHSMGQISPRYRIYSCSARRALSAACLVHFRAV